MRRTIQRAAALAAALAGGGCLLDNPAFGDAGASGTGGASGGVSGGASSGGAATGDASSGGLTGGGASMSASATEGVTSGVTSGDTSGDVSGSTGGGTGAPCGMVDQPCVKGQCCGDCLVCQADVCVTDPSLCGACADCVDGACAKTPGASCELPNEQACENTLYGALFDGCYAYAPTSGACADDGTCTPSCSQPADMPLVACDEACQDPFKCAQGLATQELAGFCTYNAPTELCKPTCVDSANASAMAFFGCNGFGKCAHVQPDVGCGFFRCNPQKTACLTMCVDQSDCVFSTSCNNGVCVP